MLRPYRGGKGPEGCGRWSLGSRNRRYPGVPRTPGLRGQGTSPGSPVGSLARVGRANALHSSLGPPFWKGPSCLPLLISPALGAQILSGLHFSSPPSVLLLSTGSLGFLPSSQALESPTSSQQVPQLWGEANSASSHTTILGPFLMQFLNKHQI